MTFITLMCSTLSPFSSPPLELHGYRINASQIISMRDMHSCRVYYVENGVRTDFESPICEIKLPGLVLYASGVADELSARVR